MTKYQKVRETEKRIYYACSDGFILSVTKVHHEEKKLKPFKKHKRFYCVKIGSEEVSVKRLIAEAFIPTYNPKKDCILHINGKKENCNLENLLIVPKSHVNVVTGAMAKSQAVIITDLQGNQHKYDSIRKAAKAFNVSYQTLLDYINKKANRSCLDGLEVKLCV